MFKKVHKIKNIIFRLIMNKKGKVLVDSLRDMFLQSNNAASCYLNKRNKKPSLEQKQQTLTLFSRKLTKSSEGKL